MLASSASTKYIYQLWIERINVNLVTLSLKYVYVVIILNYVYKENN